MIKSYKRLWNKLKANTTDLELLDLMEKYERESFKKHEGSGMKYSIKLSEQIWYKPYRLVVLLFTSKVRRNLIPKAKYDEFKKEFSNKVKLLLMKDITDDEIGIWLENTHKELMGVRKKNYKAFTKPPVTTSGFKRKSRPDLSWEECASIVIDELVYEFIPHIPKGYGNLTEYVTYYEEDWRQELWKWCWEYRERDINLKALIDKFNSLSKTEYKFYKNNIFSRMNRYITPYIAKLKYSCNELPIFNINDKYIDEETYPSDDLVSINDMCIDTTDIPKYMIEDVDTDILNDNKEIIKDIMDNFEEVIKSNMRIGYDNRDMWHNYKKVIEMRYGFNSKNKVYTLQEIGNYYGISRERIRQMEETALRLIRKYLKKRGKINDCI